MKRQTKYYAWVSNASGANDDVPLQTYNKRELKDYIRNNYGGGWTVHLMAVGIDGDGESTFPPEEIKTWTLRK